VIGNPKVARIIAAILVAMLVITLAASLFGCSPQDDSLHTEADPDSGLVLVSVSDLPAEVRSTLELIATGGPFSYDGDGVVFGNSERILPQHDRGYYREYTVQTPGESDRGAGRIIIGKNGEQYYTADHYQSFQRVRVDE
jgi:ribonuclease T1